MTQHFEIAKERFLDLIASDRVMDKDEMAREAIATADVFMAEYVKHERANKQNAKATLKKIKGCPKCYGSGGSNQAPCKNCGGTGRVEVET